MMRAGAPRLLPRVCGRSARGAWLAAVLGGMAVLGTLSPAGAQPPEGHCYWHDGACADVVADAAGRLLPGLHVAFTDPTDRYLHGVLGDAIEWGGLAVLMQGQAADDQGWSTTVTLPLARVFEDLTPRVADLDRDGMPEIIVVESAQRTGASLAVYGLEETDGGPALRKFAATPHIGTPNRWLAPVGAADLDGDGVIEIAYVDRPHLAKTLRIWRYQDRTLTEVAAHRGVTNHRIGEDFISGGIRDCGDGPEMIVATGNWSEIVAVRFDGKVVTTRTVSPRARPREFEKALACD